MSEEKDIEYDSMISAMRNAMPSWMRGENPVEFGKPAVTPPGRFEPGVYNKPDTLVVSSGVRREQENDGNGSAIESAKLWNLVYDADAAEWSMANLGTIRRGTSVNGGLTITDNASPITTPSNGDFVYFKILASVMSGATSAITIEYGQWTEYPYLVETSGTAPDYSFVEAAYPIWKYVTDTWVRCAPDSNFNLVTTAVMTDTGYLVAAGDLAPSFRCF